MSESEKRPNDVLRLKYALASFYEHSEFALLGELHCAAQERHGFSGSIEEALKLLEEMRDVRLESGDSLENTRVFASAYWTLG